MKILRTLFLKMFHGSKLILLSFTAYYHYKKLLFFPIFSALASGLSFFVLISLTFDWWGKGGTEYDILIALLVVLLIVAFLFIRAFTGISMAYAVSDYCQNGKAGISNAFLNSIKKIRIIFAWAAIEIFARFIAGKREASATDTLWSFIAGTSWQVLTFFIYPIFALENVTVWGALKRSTQLMKKYGQTTLGAVFTARAFYMPALLLMGIFILIARLLLEVSFWIFEKTSILPFIESIDSKHFIVLFLMPVMVSFIMFSFDVLMLTQTIASTVIYRYVHGKSTGIFDTKTLEKALD